MFGLMGLRNTRGLELDTVTAMAPMVVDWKMVGQCKKCEKVGNGLRKKCLCEKEKDL